MKRVREEAGWTPVWEGAIRGYARNYIKKHQWRIDEIHSFSDLMQDAYLVFLRVRNAYPRVVDPPNFMSLFKVALMNEITDKARYRSEKNKAIQPIDRDVSEITSHLIGEYSNEGNLRILLNELPEEVKLILGVFNDPQKLKELRRKIPRSKSPVRETIIMKLCRVAGVPWRPNLATEIRQALS
jgi:hypothetical protein